MVATLTGVSKQVLEGSFVNGLKPEIQAELRMLQPCGLGQMMSLAQHIEEKNSKLRQVKPIMGPGNPQSTIHYNTTHTIMPSTINQALASFAPKSSPIVEPRGGLRGESQFKRMTEVEIMERRAKRPCYRRNEKFAPRHRCKRHELQVLMVWDEGESEEPFEMGEPETDEVVEGNSLEIHKTDAETEDTRPKEVGLSLKSAVALTSLKTMKLRGEIGSQQVVVLIDSGVTHNFISTELVRKLTLPVEETRAYRVLMGTGSVQGAGICKRVLIRLQEVEIMEDFLPVISPVLMLYSASNGLRLKGMCRLIGSYRK